MYLPPQSIEYVSGTIREARRANHHNTVEKVLEKIIAQETVIQKNEMSTINCPKVNKLNGVYVRTVALGSYIAEKRETGSERTEETRNGRGGRNMEGEETRRKFKMYVCGVDVKRAMSCDESSGYKAWGWVIDPAADAA